MKMRSISSIFIILLLFIDSVAPTTTSLDNFDHQSVTESAVDITIRHVLLNDANCAKTLRSKFSLDSHVELKINTTDLKTGKLLEICLKQGFDAFRLRKRISVFANLVSEKGNDQELDRKPSENLLNQRRQYFKSKNPEAKRQFLSVLVRILQRAVLDWHFGEKARIWSKITDQLKSIYDIDDSNLKELSNDKKENINETLVKFTAKFLIGLSEIDVEKSEDGALENHIMKVFAICQETSTALIILADCATIKNGLSQLVPHQINMKHHFLICPSSKLELLISTDADTSEASSVLLEGDAFHGRLLENIKKCPSGGSRRSQLVDLMLRLDSYSRVLLVSTPQNTILGAEDSQKQLWAAVTAIALSKNIQIDSMIIGDHGPATRIDLPNAIPVTVAELTNHQALLFLLSKRTGGQMALISNINNQEIDTDHEKSIRVFLNALEQSFHQRLLFIDHFVKAGTLKVNLGQNLMQNLVLIAQSKSSINLKLKIQDKEVDQENCHFFNMNRLAICLIEKPQGTLEITTNIDCSLQVFGSSFSLPEQKSCQKTEEKIDEPMKPFGKSINCEEELDNNRKSSEPYFIRLTVKPDGDGDIKFLHPALIYSGNNQKSLEIIAWREKEAKPVTMISVSHLGPTEENLKISTNQNKDGITAPQANYLVLYSKCAGSDKATSAAVNPLSDAKYQLSIGACSEDKRPERKVCLVQYELDKPIIAQKAVCQFYPIGKPAEKSATIQVPKLSFEDEKQTTIEVCEGEKDCDKVWELKLMADYTDSVSFVMSPVDAPESNLSVIFAKQAPPLSSPVLLTGTCCLKSVQLTAIGQAPLSWASTVQVLINQKYYSAPPDQSPHAMASSTRAFLILLIILVLVLLIIVAVSSFLAYRRQRRVQSRGLSVSLPKYKKEPGTAKEIVQSDEMPMLSARSKPEITV